MSFDSERPENTLEFVYAHSLGMLQAMREDRKTHGDLMIRYNTQAPVALHRVFAMPRTALGKACEIAAKLTELDRPAIEIAYALALLGQKIAMDDIEKYGSSQDDSVSYAGKRLIIPRLEREILDDEREKAASSGRVRTFDSSSLASTGEYWDREKAEIRLESCNHHATVTRQFINRERAGELESLAAQAFEEYEASQIGRQDPDFPNELFREE